MRADEYYRMGKSKNCKVLRNKFSEEILSFDEDSFDLSYITDTTKGLNMMDKGDESFEKKMSNMLEDFNMDVQNLMTAKRKCIKQLVQDSIETTTEKVSDTDKLQIEEKGKLSEQFKTEFNLMIQQTQGELEKIKSVEMKVERVLNTMKRKKKQENILHLSHLDEFKKLNKEFCEDLYNLDRHHLQQYHKMIEEIRKDVSGIEKKILYDSQKNEMKNIRKHFKF
ncbi:hypothetical protein JTE90_020869 [Oedothorax gibbosus]|uniref:XLR/SYCP3/FAM9 domain-containing protein n=1 Tax=Oedothorax gibbosus TaxID=931172 RepID=A0AAV6URW7_9ARAC|nr:hypothetical protein JTE90_020869 [Oedothorax gibbosus]